MRATTLLLALAPALAACGDDDMSSPDAAPPATTFAVRVENVAPWTVLKSALASTKIVPSPGPLGPGEAYEITFTAGKGHRLSFAAMLGESNDWFFGPGPDGIALYDAAGAPVSGDVTAQVALWDAGTEIDQEPSVGDATGPRQSAPDAGAADPDTAVRELPVAITLTGGATFTRPATEAMIRATVTPGADRQFTLRIENVSTATTLVTSTGERAIHISPTVWALHTRPAPLFTVGQPDRGQGLELVAESGRGADLAASLATGTPTAISPGVYVVHRDPAPLFTAGVADAGRGLERIAEDGNPTDLAAAVAAAFPGASGVFTTPTGAAAAGPATPGNAYTFEVTAEPGDRLSLVTMFGWSNDWVFATHPDGIALFAADGTPASGDLSAELGIYDAGTEVDQELAIGPDTAPQQAAPDTGAADAMDLVRAVSADRYPVPASAHLRLTLTPQP
jgi:cytochrome c1